MKFRWLAGALALTLLTSACAPMQNVRRADTVYQGAESDARNYIDQMRKPQPAMESREPVRITTDPWVDTRPMRAVERRLPADADCNIVFKPAIATGLMEFAQQITQDCHIAVRVTPDAIASVNGAANGSLSGGALSQMPQAGGNSQLPALPPLPGSSMSGTMIQALPMSGSAPGLLSDINWRGPLSGLLDLVTARNGLSWRYNDNSNSISIFYLDTRTFRLDAFPVVTAMQSTIQTGTNSSLGASGGSGSSGGASGGSSGSGASGTAGSAQTTTVSMQSSLYADIENTLKSFLTPGTGRLAISPSTGTVSVTDTPEVLDRIGTLLDHENTALTQQIILHTKVLSLSVDDNDEAGVNWDIVYKTLSHSFHLSSPFQPASNAGTLGASVINTGNFAGSNVVVSALSSLGRVRTITSPSITTLNLQPAPVQIGRQIGYVASSQVSQTQGAGTVGGLEPGFVTVGFNMTLVPRLLEDNRELLLQYSINISALNQIRSVSAAGTTIEFPDVDTRLFNSAVKLRSGETLILHGFEQDQVSGNRQGTFSPFAWMLGGGIKASHSRQIIVVLITPQVVNDAYSQAGL